ncbi:MAG: hypothetical protein KJ795_03375 [Gammaproteobacteria bacterium]|nr:hypothetical protein [Gammaproteobacteria bacterium]MBU1777115.1 hypothetical protein [Gammaproteobacteria bacterium]MBU1967811.1 hypothetical protein [Gammaproteobacteria bacterium]
MALLKYVLLLSFSLSFTAGTAKAAENNSTISPTSATTRQPQIERKVTEQFISNIFHGRVSEFTVSSDSKHLTYLAWANGKPDFSSKEGDEFSGKVVVILDGMKSTNQHIWDSEIKSVSALTLSPNGKRLAYIARDVKKGFSLFVDGSKKHYDRDESEVTELQFTPDSKSFVYVESNVSANDPFSYVVVDGKRLNPFPRISNIKLSPNSNRIAYKVTTNRSSKQFAMIDNQEGKHFDSIDFQHFTFSPDSRKLAYFAGNNKKAFVVVDKKEGKPYPGFAGDLIFSPDSQHLLYVAQFAQRQWSVVIDEKEGKVYDAWAIRNPVFSPDSKHVAYVVASQPDGGGDYFVVLDGQEGKRYNAKNYNAKKIHLDYVVFSPDGNHIAYPVRLGGYGSDWIVVCDSKESRRYQGVGLLAFSPDGSRLAYVAEKDFKSFVVVNEIEDEHFDNIKSLTFSPDGKFIVYAAYSKEINKWFIVVNGQKSQPYDFVMLQYAQAGEGEEYTKGGSLAFDSPDKFHFLAVKNQQIFLVEEDMTSMGNNNTVK